MPIPSPSDIPQWKPDVTLTGAAVVVELPDGQEVHRTDETVLQEAARLVTAARGNAYGPPEQDFTRTVGMLNVLFESKLKEPLTPADLARIMVLLKVSRSVWSQKRDNWVDIAGYAACGHRCEYGVW